MPEYIEKKMDNTFILHVHVKPNSKKQEIIIDTDGLTICVRSRAIQNKANKELISYLKKKIKISSNQIKIISGLKSTNKKIELRVSEQLNEKQFLSRLT